MSEATAIFYERRGWTTCNRARAWLDTHRRPYTARDIFKQPLSEAELRDLAAAAGGAKALFSWRSPSARRLGLTPDAPSHSDDDLIALMLKEPRLIRRPLVRTPHVLLIAPDAQALAALT